MLTRLYVPIEEDIDCPEFQNLFEIAIDYYAIIHQRYIQSFRGL
jgi:hypothetical protein